MEIVGHSAIEMTMNVYGHVKLETQRRALDGLDDELSVRAWMPETDVTSGTIDHEFSGTAGESGWS